jgi:hypothetical protein
MRSLETLVGQLQVLGFAEVTPTAENLVWTGWVPRDQGWYFFTRKSDGSEGSLDIHLPERDDLSCLLGLSVEFIGNELTTTEGFMAKEGEEDETVFFWLHWLGFDAARDLLVEQAVIHEHGAS